MCIIIVINGRKDDYMKKAVIICAVLICFLFIFSGCKGKEAEEIISSEDTYSSLEQVSSCAPIEDENKEKLISDKIPVPLIEQNDATLLSEIKSVGKTVTAIGELKNTEYLSAVNRLQALLDNYGKNISFSFYSLNDKKALCYNTEKPLFCACTVKAPYTLYCCKQMEKGNYSLDSKIVYEKKHYEPGTGDMQYSPFGTEFSLETALYKSMNISDNVGYLMSVDLFGRDGYNSWISSLGCQSLQIKPTVWSLKAKSDELILAWLQIYDYFKTDSEYAAFLYSSCVNSGNAFAITSLDDISYSHKSGHSSSGDWPALCDAGIIWQGEESYAFSILTDAAGPLSADAYILKSVMEIVHNELF